MRKHGVELYLFVAGCAAMLLTGCTLIGAWLGHGMDRSNRGALAPATIDALSGEQPGDSVILTLHEGSTVAGVFVDLAETGPDSLLARVDRYPFTECTARETIFPGDTLRIQRLAGDTIDVQYLSADERGIWFRRLGREQVYREVYSTIFGLSWCDGRKHLRPPIEDAFNDGRLARMFSVRVMTQSGIRSVPMQEIARVQVRESWNTFMWVGGALGLAADAYFLSLILKPEEEKPSPPPKGGSYGDGGSLMCGCPFVFGRTGGEWRVETECFSGAVFRAAQRRDWARLEHTRPEYGRLPLRVVNLLQEVDSVDQLAVLRIEHDEGTELYPTEDGRMLAVRPVAPVSARDDRGNDILPLIRARDASCWLAVPEQQPKDRGRRWMECRFPLQADADSVTLLFDVQNTQWGARLQYGFFSLFGSGLQSAYDRWNADATARQQIRDILLREGMLEVSIWDGTRWRPAGHVWEVGLSAWRAVALRIGVEDIRDSELRLRLEAPAGVWMVRHGGMDVLPPGDVRVRRLHPSVATRDWGEDCLPQLLQEDGRYVSLDTGEGADVIFTVSDDQPVEGRRVTWVLESAGYYRMKVPASAPPDTGLLTRMFTEPGFFARHADEAFWFRIAELQRGGE